MSTKKKTILVNTYSLYRETLEIIKMHDIFAAGVDL